MPHDLACCTIDSRQPDTRRPHKTLKTINGSCTAVLARPLRACPLSQGVPAPPNPPYQLMTLTFNDAAWPMIGHAASPGIAGTEHNTDCTFYTAAVLLGTERNVPALSNIKQDRALQQVRNRVLCPQAKAGPYCWPAPADVQKWATAPCINMSNSPTPTKPQQLKSTKAHHANTLYKCNE
jgi:hypothetical protein